ncbi:MAG: ATP-binding protein [Syntrophorhabdales bacterium]
MHQIALEMQNEEFRKAQDIIEESRTRYVDLYEFAPFAYLTFDETGRVIEANLTVCGLLGVERRSLIGKFFSPFVTPDDRDTFLKHRFEVLKNRVKQRCELNLERADGSRFYVSVESIEAKSAQGQTVRSALTDISERKRAERERDLLERLVREGTAELQRADDKLAEEKKEREVIKAQLRQAQKMEALGALSGGIAHDFNNILATMIGFTELTKDHLPQRSREIHHLERVLEAGLRGRELIKQLLTFSRKTEQNKKLLQLGGIVREAVDLLRASIPTSISIRADLKNEMGVILADPVQMQQVLMNLCANAVCAMQEKGGVLDIGLNDYTASPTNGATGMKPGPYMKLSVRDTGSGIAPEIMDKVFDPFFTTKGPGEGSGLGLSVVHDIITQSNGYIVVKSEPSAGTVFTTYLPIVGEEHAIDAAGDDAVPSGHERILFIER